MLKGIRKNISIIVKLHKNKTYKEILGLSEIDNIDYHALSKMLVIIKNTFVHNIYFLW